MAQEFPVGMRAAAFPGRGKGRATGHPREARTRRAGGAAKAKGRGAVLHHAARRKDAGSRPADRLNFLTINLLQGGEEKTPPVSPAPPPPPGTEGEGITLICVSQRLN